MRVGLPWMIAALLSASTALAGGYAVPDQDAEASGRGGTGTAALEGAASVQYNPANLSRVFSLDAVVGATAIAPTASAADPTTGQRQSTEFGPKFPPHVYAAYGNGKYGVGLGFNAPFGGGLTWPDDFRGRFEILSQDLQVLAGDLAFAYQITPQLSAGATLSLYRASVTVEKRVDFVDSEGTALIGGSGVGVGASLGLSFAPNEHIRLGLTGTLPTTVGLTGNAHFSDVPPSFNPMLQDQEIRAAVPLPGRLALGSAFYLDSVRLFADLDYTFWSAFDRFAVKFAQSGDLDVSEARNWENSLGVRFGAEKSLGDVWTVRGGLLFDQKASPASTLSPSLPDSDRIGVSIGGGRDFGAIQIDAAYQFVMFVPRSTEGDAFPASYSASAHLLALSFRFATPPGVASATADTSLP